MGLSLVLALLFNAWIAVAQAEAPFDPPAVSASGCHGHDDAHMDTDPSPCCKGAKVCHCVLLPIGLEPSGLGLPVAVARSEQLLQGLTHWPLRLLAPLLRPPAG